MNPLRQDDPRHEEAVRRTSKYRRSPEVVVNGILSSYYTALEKQGVVLVEAYAGDDAGRT